jgi:hypothetical protein
MATGVTVTVSYAINTITKSGPNIEVLYTLTNTAAPLVKKYLDVYDELTLYSGVASTMGYSDIKDLVKTNFYTLAYSTMSSFADEARLLILNSIGSTAGTAVTGVASFGLFTKLSVTKGILPFTVDYTYAEYKAGI